MAAPPSHDAEQDAPHKRADLRPCSAAGMTLLILLHMRSVERRVFSLS
ncbi:hypothetical protein [Marivita cryptomonadis]|nr:hypothetical protein [Marivita cryptomonadis]MBM2375066.1 hypothetical protein [Marivita cryptomonadis]MBM2394497.1 hypothetical protein [Marivita cryptomonadis]MBM2460786.1 hypothetical protein [Marivita cryptomonadis]MBM2474428.1 hypothetical protein [Marivita cryptomonadis]MBM2488314.1 hypothetical protein [Marivita cryptomonadis]